MVALAKLAVLSSAALPGLCSCQHTGAQAASLRGSAAGAKSPSAMPPIASFAASFEVEGGEGAWAYNAAHARLAVDSSSRGDAAYIRPDFQDRMFMQCDFQAEKCVTTFRSLCFSGLIRSRTEAFVRLWRRLPEAMAAPEYPSGREIQGEHCDVWNITVPGVGLLRVCLRKDGVPLHLYSSADPSYVGPENVRVSTFDIYFHNISSQPPAIAEAKCPEEDCPLSCPVGGVAPMTVFRASHGEPWGELHNRDTADLVGDIGFLRPSPGSEPPYRKYLETFNVTVNKTWGKGRDCNYIKEKGDDVCEPAASPEVAKLVTRSSAESYQGPCNGQCGANAVVGSWYVFPKEGRCPEGGQIGAEGCTWKIEATKVVLVSCVWAEGNVREAWRESFGKAPWPKMQAALLRGIAACADVREAAR